MDSAHASAHGKCHQHAHMKYETDDESVLVYFPFVFDHLVYLWQFERGQYPIQHVIGVHLPHDEHVPVMFHGIDFQIHIPVWQDIEVYYVQNVGQHCSSSVASLRSGSCPCATSGFPSWPTTVWLLHRALPRTAYL